jgi:hypothetical protein
MESQTPVSYRAFGAVPVPLTPLLFPFTLRMTIACLEKIDVLNHLFCSSL